MLIYKEDRCVELFYYILVFVEIENIIDGNFVENFFDVGRNLLDDIFFNNFDVEIIYI